MDVEWGVQDRLLFWLMKWRVPVQRAMRQNEFNDARKKLYAARQALDDRELSEEDVESLKYLLCYTEFEIALGEHEGALPVEEYDKSLQQLSQASSFADAEKTRWRLLTQLRVAAELASGDELSEDEFQALFAQVPECEKARELWYLVAGWAFKHQDQALLARAYEEFLVRDSDEPADWTCMRARLMHRLLMGRATRRDIALTLELAQQAPQVREFEQLIWPYCQQAGLGGEELEHLLEARWAAVKSQAAGASA